MKVAIIIPWWPDTRDEWRVSWFAQARSYWQDSGRVVHVGVGVEGAARNAGIVDSGADVFLVTDADSVISYDMAERAIERAAEAPGLVVPHDRYVYLGPGLSNMMTFDLVAANLNANDDRWPTGEDETIVTGSGEFESIGTLGVGGPVAFSRATWIAAGGYDEQLVRAYDGAFALACGTLVAEQRRIEGDYVHLWHPRAPDEDPPETWETIRAYHAAAESGPDAMRVLIENRRVAQ